MKKLLAALAAEASLLLLAVPEVAQAEMTRYQLVSPFPTSYFDYDTSTSALGSFLIEHPVPVGPLNPAHTDPATTIIFESPTQVHFFDTETTFDATFRYVWTIEFLANFHTDGSYDGTWGYGETLNKYRLSDDSLELTSIAPYGGDAFGFYSIGPSPVAAVPEPETYAMLLAGLGLLGFAARRRKLKEAASA